MASNSYYTTEEDELLKKMYPTATKIELLSAFPNRTILGLTNRASQLGVKKDKRYYEAGKQAEDTVIGHLSEIEKGYLAGIIDADGCIRLNRRFNNKSHQPVYAAYVQIYTTSPALLEWLGNRFPDVSRKEVDNRQEEHPEWRVGYTWTLSGSRRVMIFCREIAPYLIIKREQAKLIADGYVHLPETERFALFQKLKDLKKTS
jgi:hypothetical protein